MNCKFEGVFNPFCFCKSPELSICLMAHCLYFTTTTVFLMRRLIHTLYLCIFANVAYGWDCLPLIYVLFFFSFLITQKIFKILYIFQHFLKKKRMNFFFHFIHLSHIMVNIVSLQNKYVFCVTLEFHTIRMPNSHIFTIFHYHLVNKKYLITWFHCASVQVHG